MDGACEPASGQGPPKCSFGGIILCGDEKFSFGEVLPDRLASQWLARAGKEQMVFECELLPYLVGLSLLPEACEERDALVFIDNEAARKTFVKAFTRSDEGALFGQCPSPGRRPGRPGVLLQSPDVIQLSRWPQQSFSAQPTADRARVVPRCPSVVS